MTGVLRFIFVHEVSFTINDEGEEEIKISDTPSIISIDQIVYVTPTTLVDGKTYSMVMLKTPKILKINTFTDDETLIVLEYVEEIYKLIEEKLKEFNIIILHF